MAARNTCHPLALFIQNSIEYSQSDRIDELNRNFFIKLPKMFMTYEKNSVSFFYRNDFFVDGDTQYGCR